MSLINDALKKAAKEKGPSEKDPSFGSEGFDIPPPKIRKDRKGILILASVSIGVLTFGILLLTIAKSFPPRRPALEVAQIAKREALSEETASLPLPPPPEPPPPEKKTEPLPQTPQPPPSIPIQSPLALNGIVHGNGEELAILNNQISRIGDEIDGATLQEIGNDFVILEKEGKRFQLKMK